MKNNPVVLEIFQQHIILYCKGHYKFPSDSVEDFFEGLRMIWAIRCGYNYEQSTEDVYIDIANDMYDIIKQCKSNFSETMMHRLHRELSHYNTYVSESEGLTPLKVIIWEYRSIIQNLQVRENVNGRYFALIKLPKSKKVKVFNRILSGNGYYNDYKLIETK